jgi:hypothetical protein
MADEVALPGGAGGRLFIEPHGAAVRSARCSRMVDIVLQTSDAICVVVRHRSIGCDLPVTILFGGSERSGG